MCLLDGRKAAALTPNPDPSATAFWWNVYLATDDFDATVARAVDGRRYVIVEPMESRTRARWRSSATPSAPSSACGRAPGTSAARW